MFLINKVLKKKILNIFPSLNFLNYKIIDAIHLVKTKIQDKHEKIYNKNGKTSHRSILCFKNNINCNRNVAGNLNICSLNNYFFINLKGDHYIFDRYINASNNIMKL